jgi:hypothetical protein
VHSDLTTGVQIADLVAYCISWGYRDQRLTKPHREELAGFAGQIRPLIHKTNRRIDGKWRSVWSFSLIHDLRTRIEKGLVVEEKGNAQLSSHKASVAEHKP